jgi:hypothetical protein
MDIIFCGHQVLINLMSYLLKFKMNFFFNLANFCGVVLHPASATEIKLGRTQAIYFLNTKKAGTTPVF